MKIAPTLLFLCLVIVFIQDLKYRKIHVMLPLFIFSISFYSITIKTYDLFQIVLLNFCFFLITIIILTIYMSLKSKRFLDPFTHYFGLGDLLFYLSITPLFVLRNFVAYFILSLIFSILMQFSVQKLMKEKTVPLAGFASLFLAVVIMADIFMSFQKFTLL